MLYLYSYLIEEADTKLQSCLDHKSFCIFLTLIKPKRMAPAKNT